MYDPETDELIKRSPSLFELDTAKLPDELSAAFAQIVAFRSRLRESKDSIEPPDIDVDRLRRLAFTFESYVSLLRDRPNKVAAAFVSGTAYQLLWLIAASTGGNEKRSTQLLHDSISSDVSATLLFLIAGYTGDATEVASRMDIESQPMVLRELVESISLLARGKLLDVVEMDVPDWAVEIDELYRVENIATFELYQEIFIGLKRLASELLGIATTSSVATFRNVMKLSVEQISLGDADGFEDSETSIVHTFAGPHHLASLLLQVANTLLTNSVLKIPPPQGIDALLWGGFTSSVAYRRPYLWANHQDAVSKGYLEQGVSSCVSFPTGAGKSTISELKIATTLLLGGKVIFLVPTHALVSQVYRDLKKTFSEYDIRSTALVEGEYSETEEHSLPDIAVVTPERCLTQLGIAPEAFVSVRLVVFDECHLLHPRAPNDQRSLDAMFCVLGLFNQCADADLLFLSAMMKNSQEIGDWISSVTKRPCLTLDLDWKPTRQARGCVIYDQDQLNDVQELLAKRKQKSFKERLAKQARFDRGELTAKKRPKFPPVPNAAEKRDLPVGPKILFCLRQMWAGDKFEDYLVVPILNDTVDLTSNKNWNLTANRNEVAKQIASNFATSHVKTLFFSQNKDWVAKISREVASKNEGSNPSFQFTSEEKRWLEISVKEAGNEDCVFKPIGGISACHHGFLLPSERSLNESTFTRKDGIMVLAATPTLAQGINLPAEAVIMAGDDRFDQSTGYNSQLKAHELLNAAGRAGRAGFTSHGVVLVIPGEIVGLDVKDESVQISDRWLDLKESFANPDKCLDIEDPVDVILDLLQEEITDEHRSVVEYFLTRLPVGDNDDPAKQMLAKTLGARKAKLNDRVSEFKSKVVKAMTLRNDVKADIEESTWHSELASSSGIAAFFISELENGLSHLDGLVRTVDEWLLWFFTWVRETDERLNVILNRAVIEELGKAGCSRGQRRTKDESINLLLVLMKQRCNGATLIELEQMMGVDSAKVGQCENARKLVFRWMRPVVYGLGVIPQIVRKSNAPKTVSLPTELAVLASTVRDGYSSCELLALSHVLKEPHARAEVIEKYSSIKQHLSSASSTETFGKTKARLEKAHSLATILEDFSDA